MFFVLCDRNTSFLKAFFRCDFKIVTAFFLHWTDKKDPLWYAPQKLDKLLKYTFFEKICNEISF